MEHAGFKTAVIRSVTLQINQTARVDVAEWAKWELFGSELNWGGVAGVFLNP